MNGQRERVSAYMHERGSITPLEAWQLLGVYRLSARIHELRQSGMHIERENCAVENRYGEKCTVARYVLRSPQQELFCV